MSTFWIQGGGVLVIRRAVQALVMLGFGLLVAPVAAGAEQMARIPRIGLVSGAANPARPVLWEPFFEALREIGYVEGRHIIIERRFADGKNERIPEFVANLVRLKVDVIVATGTTEALAAKQATTTIPIVMVTAPDPIESGLVSSLSRPGGNITGLSLLAPELTGKRLELLREALSGATRIALLSWGADSTSENIRKDAEGAAQALGVQLRVLQVRDPDGLANTFSAMSRERVQGLLVPFRLLFFNQRDRIVELAAKSRLPAIYDSRVFVEAGGLMSYGPRLPDLYRRAATYVDKILKGTKPGELPVEQPTRFELIVNLKTAKALALTIPPSVLVRADQVIQ